MVHTRIMAMLRAVLSFIVGGAMVGVVVASVVGPKFLTWYNTPGGTGTVVAQCECAKLTRQVADEVIAYQLTGAAVGGGLGLALGIGFTVWRRRRAKPAATPG